MSALAALSAEEVAAMRAAFGRCDVDGGGTIDRAELAAALDELGRGTSEDELDALLKEIDEDGSGLIDFFEFAGIFVRGLAQQDGGAEDTVDAFVALGGEADRSGHVSTAKLVSVVRSFGLTLDIKRLISQADDDGSGVLEFDEFARLLSSEARRGADGVARDVELPRRF